MRRFWLFAAIGMAARAETHTLTLKQAVDRAAAQNPEVVMARMDELKADQAIRIAKDPFSTHIGAAADWLTATAIRSALKARRRQFFRRRRAEYLFNRPQIWTVAQSKENAKGAGMAVELKRDDIAYRVATMYVDVERAFKLEDALQKQVESLDKVLQTVDARVQLGRELPMAKQEATGQPVACAAAAGECCRRIGIMRAQSGGRAGVFGAGCGAAGGGGAGAPDDTGHGRSGAGCRRWRTARS